MDLITAHYKSKDELIVINLEQMVVAMPRKGNVDREGEEEGVTYTSFLMTVRLGNNFTVDTLLPYEDFLDMMQVVEDEPDPEPNKLKEIILISKSETENVLDKLRDLIKRYKWATVADYYALCDVPATHIDDRYGWTDLSVVTTIRQRHGWVIQLPEPERLGE